MSRQVILLDKHSLDIGIGDQFPDRSRIIFIGRSVKIHETDKINDYHEGRGDPKTNG